MLWAKSTQCAHSEIDKGQITNSKKKARLSKKKVRGITSYRNLSFIDKKSNTMIYVCINKELQALPEKVRV